MNAITRVIMYSPAMLAYLRGELRFSRRDFGRAISNFDKCLTHPNFNNELVYSRYGQALCALGRFNEGHSFLLKACDFYEACGWQFKNEHEVKYAQDTLSSLRYISENTDIAVRPDLLIKRVEDFDKQALARRVDMG